ncbi:unnamed protein product [Rotaria sordida]|uniref:BEN domain-containing protein n=1 Tax=Rotaria sordida TaxID=392033 RepID=A0A814KTR8_9BILA|nr:unnamed protein product [Rotaria sordida]CAF1112291.1 unnamed protein product [Rotaria sordida]CAF3853935.1 unnamed protein product [Rotaria sordida]CAF4035272.1 unnamed protein product [Rotaria sordida]
MRIKTSYRKKRIIDEEKENSTGNDAVVEQSLQSIVGNSKHSGIDNNSNIDLINAKEETFLQDEFDNIISPCSIINRYEDMDLVIDDKTNVAEFNADIISVLYEMTNLVKNDPITIHSQRGEKRSLENSSDNIENEKHSDSSKDTCDADISTRPKHPETIQYFIETADILRGDQEITNRFKDAAIVDITSVLNLDKNQLTRCHKKSSTATARAIIKCLFPHSESNFGYTQVHKAVIDAIVDYTKFSNPNGNASDAAIRRAISNYFSYLNRQRKTKEMVISNQAVKLSNKDSI